MIERDSPVAQIPKAMAPERIGRGIELTFAWLESHWIEILVASAIGAGIYLLLAWLRSRAARRVTSDPDGTSLPTIIARALARTGHFFMLMVSVRLVTSFAEAPAPIERVVAFLFTVAAVFQAAIWVREIILGFIERRASEGRAHSETLANALTLIRLLVTLVLFAIAAVVVLDNLGVNVTGLVAGLGIGGIAIGLAAQGIFEDLFAALAIIFDQPFRRGETITYDSTTATVEQIGLKSTRLRKISGEEVVISNKNLLDKEIINLTRLSRRRTTYVIGVIYQTRAVQLRALPDLLRRAVEGEGATFVRAGFTGFGASSIDFGCEFDVMSDDYETVYQTRHRVGLAIFEALTEAGVEIAYPTQTTFTAAPDGTMVLPYPEQGFRVVEDEH